MADQPGATRSEVLRFRVLVALAVSPILIAAVRNGLLGWFPSADAAITAVRTRDVFTHHPPLIGLPTFASSLGGIDYSYLGAPLNHLLAIPVRLFGISWGSLIGIALLNTSFLVTALWLVRRRVGYRLGSIACVFAAVLLWAVGSQALVDPTPVESGITGIIAFYVACWSLADDDATALIPFAFIANYLFLVHLKFVVVVPFLGGLALAVWVVRALRQWRIERADGEERGHPRLIRLTAAGIVTLGFWLPPLIDQFTSSPGNMRALFRAVTSPSATQATGSLIHRVSDAIGVVSAPVVIWPFWSRWSFASPQFTVYGPTMSFVAGIIGLALATAIIAWVTITAMRRSDRTMVTGVITAVAAWLAWIVSALAQPQRGWPHRYFQVLWPTAMFIWMVIALGVLRALRGTRFATALKRPATETFAAFGIVALCVAFSVPIANYGSATTQDAIPIARRLYEQSRAIERGDRPVDVDYSMTVWPYVSSVVLAMQTTGVDFRFTSHWAQRTYGSHRSLGADRSRVDREVLITDRPPVDEPGRLIATSVDYPGGIDRFMELRRRFLAGEASTRTLTIPPGHSFTADQRLLIERFLNDQLAAARSNGKSMFDNPKVVDVLLDDKTSTLIGLIDVPGMSSAQMRAWLDQQRALLGGGAVFVYERTLD